MVKICDEKMCCGCTACFSICPNSAIEIISDKYGFKKPMINPEKCINCKLCQKVCPINKKLEFKETNCTWAAKAEDKNTRQKSQSGGAFAVLANEVLKNGGVVYGVSSDKTNVKYQRVENLQELELLKKSTYVQADIIGTHKCVARDLINNKKVLFSGTPCYVASILSYLSIRKISIENLITIDLICYGVPSPRLYEEYLQLEEKIKGKKIVDFVFRDKEWSLNEKYSKITWENSKQETLTNGYLRLFSTKLATRQSCLECVFAKSERISDITIGDYWGIEKIKPEFDDNKGVSVIICHSQKGRSLFESVKNSFILFETSFLDAQKKQLALTRPSGVSKQYDDFWNEYLQNGLSYVLKKYCDYDTSCHINVQGKKILTLDKHFLYSHLRGTVKNYLPNAARPFLRRILRK